MIKYKIIDNFLPYDEFQMIRQVFFESTSCPWYYYENENLTDYKGKEVDSPKFVHLLNDGDGWLHSGSKYISGLLKKLETTTIYRIKLNFTPKTAEKNVNTYHFDRKKFVDEGLHFSIGIFYLNTNNGETIFEDGTRIKAVENRMLIFPGNCLHSGITSTDDRKVLININFFNKETNLLYE